MSEWTTRWTGKYPNLCRGRWHLYRDGNEVDNPFNGSPAYTDGTYCSWHFENWLEVFEDYHDGLSEEDWIDENREWLESIAEEGDFPKIFRAFQENDFREMSCGGCI